MLTLMAKMVMAAFVVYGLADLITIEDGPFGLFRRPREWLGKYPHPAYPSGERMYNVEAVTSWRKRFSELSGLHELWVENDIEFLNSFRGSLYGVLECAYCMGVWIALIVDALFLVMLPATTSGPELLFQGVMIFGGSLAGQRLLKRITDDE